MEPQTLILSGCFVVGLAIGAGVTYARVSSSFRKLLTQTNVKYEQLLQEQLHDKQQLGRLELTQERLTQIANELEHWQTQATNNQQLNEDLKRQLESQQVRFEEVQANHDEKLRLLESSEQRLMQQFENLANRIFEQKSASFTQSSRAGLDALLMPLKEQLDGFKRQINEQYNKEGQERASLKTEIQHLLTLNKQITEEANALTKALKGDNKKQGNWGEIILERVLQESGLREGHEYHIQGQFKDELGKAYKPDVIVHLPNDKDVIIDSKVSLAAYERYFSSLGDEDNRSDLYLKEHIGSIRQHIKELGAKKYQSLEGIRTLDYVLMFIPVEPAFLLAMEQAPELVKMAFDENVMLVSPTNLLVALRTINHIWQYEYQNQNAEKIASQAGKLYDKFHGFVDDMEKIGRNLETTQKNYESAVNKLSSGRDNLVRQVERFRELGVQPSKRLSGGIAEKGLENSD